MRWSEADPGTVDVAIVGGGAMGASIAWHLMSDPGFSGRVAVVERDPSFVRAATSLTNSCIRQQFGTEVNIRISQAGAAFIRGFRARLGREDAPEIRLEGFGYLYLAAAPSQVAALREAAALQAGLGVATRLIEAPEIAQTFPWLATDDLHLASHNPGDEGWFDSASMVEWLRRDARDRGALMVAGEVASVETTGARVRGLVLADGRRIAAGHVVNAAGTAAGEVSAMAGRALPLERRKRYSVVFSAERPAPGPLPLTIDPSGVHVRSEGERFLCGYAPAEDRPVAADDFAWDDPFEETAWPVIAARIPTFERLRLRASWVGHYEYNRFDRNAIIGPDPEIAGLIQCCGFSGHGIQQAPAMGRGVADLVIYGAFRALDLSALAPSRLLEGRPVREPAVI